MQCNAKIKKKAGRQAAKERENMWSVCRTMDGWIYVQTQIEINICSFNA